MAAKHSLYYDLLEALREAECPVCQLLRRAIGQMLDSFLYENVNNVALRERLGRSRGFCAAHAWQLRRRGDPLAHAILYADQLSDVLQRLGIHAEKGPGAPELPVPSLRSLARALEAESACPLCEMRREAEQTYLRAVADYLGSEEFAQAYFGSFGLCRPHLDAFLRLNAPPGATQVVARRFVLTALQLLEGLAEVKRKADYRFAGEERQASKDVWVQAVRFWVGSPDVF